MQETGRVLLSCITCLRQSAFEICCCEVQLFRLMDVSNALLGFLDLKDLCFSTLISDKLPIESTWPYLKGSKSAVLLLFNNTRTENNAHNRYIRMCIVCFITSFHYRTNQNIVLLKSVHTKQLNLNQEMTLHGNIEKF